MRVNIVPTIIAIVISVLIAYGFYAFWGGGQASDMHYATTCSALVFSLATLCSAIGVDFETSRITTVIRTVAGLLFIVGLGALILIINITNSLPILIITMGVLSSLFVLVVYALSRSGQ